jgi:hypothetical protein
MVTFSTLLNLWVRCSKPLSSLSFSNTVKTYLNMFSSLPTFSLTPNSNIKKSWIFQKKKIVFLSFLQRKRFLLHFNPICKISRRITPKDPVGEKQLQNTVDPLLSRNSTLTCRYFPMIMCPLSRTPKSSCARKILKGVNGSALRCYFMFITPLCFTPRIRGW